MRPPGRLVPAARPDAHHLCVSHPSVQDERGFLFEIVANKKNSVDVDKFDYISRDCYNVGLKTSYDFDRSVLNWALVVTFPSAVRGSLASMPTRASPMWRSFALFACASPVPSQAHEL